MSGNHARVAIGLIATVGLCVSANSANARDADASPSDHLAPLRACQAQTDPGQRLACYDAAAATVLSQADKGDLRIVDAAEIKRTRRGLFGFALPDLGIFGGGDDEPDMDMLETTITSVRYTAPDAFQFKTPEGATWQVSNAPARQRQVHAGDAVVLKKAAMGSYFIRIAGQIGIKGRRIQ